jgi:YegS/Rv2252/BmrU family lipid kinase
MPKRSYFLIVNLIAGQGRCKEIFPKVRRELDRRKVDYDLHYTNEPLEAVDVAEMGVNAGFTHIVAMGGDGTINEVVNGLVDSNACLAVIPAGKGNDFIRMIGVPADPLRAIDVLIPGKERQVDLGHVLDSRYFVNGLGIGIDAQVAYDVLAMERLTGTLAYISSAVKEVFRFKAFRAHLNAEGLGKDQPLLSLGIANGKYCGGGFKLAPHARLDDGLLDIAMIEDFPKLERLIRLPQARAGKHIGLSRVSYRQMVEVAVSSQERLIAHIDGEPYQLPEKSFVVRAEKGALRVLTPA